MKRAKLNVSEKKILFYQLAHPQVPAPQIGYTPDWDALHRGIPDIIAYHRACPGIQVREDIGITLSVPYNIRFFRNGRIEIDSYWEAAGPRVFQVRPIQSSVPVTGVDQSFPGFIVELPPDPALKFSLHLFMLGDIRVNAWILQSGVELRGLTNEYTLMILPLPYHVYPPGVSVGQALAFTLQGIRGQLKIPIDLDFSQLPAEQEFISLEKGQPVVQYLPVKIPQILLHPVEGD